MKRLRYDTDLCVVGGGLAGMCTAIAAARHGIRVVLIHDRPVFGGNASGEIRMWVCGAHGRDNRETGILEELTLENYYQNPGMKFPLWDGVLYGAVMNEPRITALLNTSVLDAGTDGNRIVSVTGWQSNAETFHTVHARWFADCSGDSILAPLTGARYSRRESNPVAVRRALFGAFIGFLLGVRQHALVEEPVKSLENSSPNGACSFCRGDLSLGKAATVSILSYGRRQ